MKNKGLIATLILLTILVVGELFYNKSEKRLNLSEKQVVKIGILQYVTHDALDAIEKGVEDGLAQEGYKVTLSTTISKFVISIIQIFFLYYYQNYYLYHR